MRIEAVRKRENGRDRLLLSPLAMAFEAFCLIVFTTGACVMLGSVHLSTIAFGLYLKLWVRDETIASGYLASVALMALAV